MTGALEVLATGPQTLVQDEGRRGLAAVGVGRAGAADRTAYRLGNRMLGNPDNTASLEVLSGGVSVRVRGSVTVCLTGATAPAMVTSPSGVRHGVGHGSPQHLPHGSVLSLGMADVGLRTYLAVHGGLDVPVVLGSRSTDVLAGLGPPPVQPGDVIPVGVGSGTFPGVDVAARAAPAAGEVTLRVLPGPRRDWFVEPQVLATTGWAVSDRSNRVGLRLDGGRLARTAERVGSELPSEGMVRGAVQVPPNGQPVLFLADHPVTGGYPVIAVVRTADVDLAAQLRPGQPLRFRWA